MLDSIRYILDFQWAHGLSLLTARIFFMAFFMLITLFGVLQKKAYVFRGAEDCRKWRDLRIWVIIVMAIQIGLYLYF